MSILNAIKNLFKGGGNAMSDLNTNCIGATMQAATDMWWQIFNGMAMSDKLRPLPIAVLSTAYLSNLVGSEIKYEVADEWLNAQLQRNFLPKLDETTQKTLVGGYVVIKPYYTKSEKMFFDVVGSNEFVPMAVDENGQIIEGYFKDECYYNNKTYIRKEHHLYADGFHNVESKVYEVGSNRELPLDTVPRWAGLSAAGRIKSDVPLIVTYRTPYANNVDPTSDLPISMYANSVRTLQNINIAHTDYLREMEKMRAKIFCDPLLLTDGKLSEDLFVSFEASEDITKQIKEYAPTPREAEYKNALNTELRIYEIETGISCGTFTFDSSKGLVTATQVLSEDKTTYNTVKQLQKQLKPCLIHLVDACVALAAHYGKEIKPEEPIIEFGDSVFEDTGTECTRRLQMVQAGILKAEKFIQWYFGVTEEDAKEMLPEMSEMFGGEQ